MLLSPNTLTKSIFLTRLLSYLHGLSDNQLGFIPDVMKILRSYGLVSHLWKFLEDVSFPEKPTWKKTSPQKCHALAHIQTWNTNLTTTTLPPLVKFLQIRNPPKFGTYLKTMKKSNFANSSPSCVLADGQQDSFKLAFSTIKCFWTHSNTHLANVRLLLPSVTIGTGVWT